jgi:hypothetical protein
LLVPLKRSPEYHLVRRRVAQQLPIDSWREGDLHFFVFVLAEPPDARAVFLMHPTATRPISAVVVDGPDGQPAAVTDLRDPTRSYTAPPPVAQP